VEEGPKRYQINCENPTPRRKELWAAVCLGGPIKRREEQNLTSAGKADILRRRTGGHLG